jgi:hypothetical protein
MRGCEGVDYELGDLRVVDSRVTYSGRWNEKMRGLLPTDLGDGVG